MRGLLLSSVGAVGISLGLVPIASSADMPRTVYAPVPFSVAYNWSGFYVGGHGGYGWGALNIVSPSADIDGWFGGGQLGVNWQAGRSPWVVGIEVDSSFGDIGRHMSFTYRNSIADAFSEVSYFGTARARLGYAIDRAMIYGTGGLAWAHHEVGFYSSLNRSNALATASNSHLGWAAGVGFEWALSRNWTMKFEYMYNFLGKESYLADVVPGGVDADLKFGTAKFGLNYMFDWGRGQLSPKF